MSLTPKPIEDQRFSPSAGQGERPGSVAELPKAEHTLSPSSLLPSQLCSCFTELLPHLPARPQHITLGLSPLAHTFLLHS